MQISDESPARPGPLASEHQALGAKLGEFGGWLMPLDYRGGGVRAEHAAVRESVGLFDVSHMGTLTIMGPDTVDLLDSVLVGDIAKLPPGAAKYTLMCDDDGGVIDDLIVYRRGDGAVLIPNAANSAEVVDRLSRERPSRVEVRDDGDETVILAVQGPRSRAVLEVVVGSKGVGFKEDLALRELDYLRFAEVCGPDGEEVLLARTGYTGELGYELMIPVAQGRQWWSRVMAAVEDFGGRACGLGARDVLRTEMGYPLHGQDVSRGLTPLEAGLGWTIAWDKSEFRGRGALVALREKGIDRRLRGLRCVDRGVPRPGMVVDTRIGPGSVTSGTFSPVLGEGIALAMLPAAVEPGEEVAIDIRGRGCRATVVPTPFVDSDPRRDPLPATAG
ncbi:MAG: glycine cleavage system aminomethyltransferase GcvT [Candidatus Nanopelagicales bacterium]|nr:glycine cleavage system aminomethyltransferase GcvT [Candidatus Nanopelagicales bacterium]